MGEGERLQGIRPIPSGVARPFWSVMIPTYNRTKWLARALSSILEQKHNAEEMQIDVVDNCSDEGEPRRVVREVGGERVGYYQQPRQVSMAENWNACIARARGRVVHILHDDDYVLPGFYEALRGPLERQNEVGAAFCRCAFIDERSAVAALSPLHSETPGVMKDWLLRIAVRPEIQCPAIVVRREVYERLGGFDPTLAFAADWEMWIRIAAYTEVWYEPRVLACYQNSSLSRDVRARKGALNLGEARKVIELARRWLPASVAHRTVARARAEAAKRGLRIARAMVDKRDFDGAMRYALASLKCSFSPDVLGLMGRLAVGAALRTASRARTWP